MKRLSIITLSLAAIVAGSFSSCQDEELGYTAEEIARSKFERDYQANFERDYGKIAPGHTWGFESNAKTRSQEAATRYKLIRQTVDVDLGNNIKETVPVDAQYMTSPGSSSVEERLYAGKNCPPVVSAEERAYVFAYLRTHPNQGSTECGLDNYFMQDLHQDPHPDSVHGTDHCPGWGFMNNLYFDDSHFNDFNGTSASPDYYVVHTDVQNPNYHDSYGTANGNNGNNSSHKDNSTYRYNRYRYYYVPAGGTWDGVECPSDFKGGYYLCFDYESWKPANNGLGNDNRVYANISGAEKPFGLPDGVYNDWVIKLTAGQYNTHRVFCEDLGSTLDLDFNDLVFDYIEYGHVLEITVLALVGTLPIDMICNNETTHIKTGSTIQPSVNDVYSFYKTTTTHNAETGKDEITYNSVGISDLSIKVSTVGPMGECFIANQEGKAPYMLQVPVGTAWPDENQRIETKYTFFSDYVTAPQSKPDWWREPTITVFDAESGIANINWSDYIVQGHKYVMSVTMSEATYVSFNNGTEPFGEYFGGTKVFRFIAGASFSLGQNSEKISKISLYEERDLFAEITD